MSQEQINQSAGTMQLPSLQVGRWTRFALSLAVLSVVWLIGLPWVGTFSVVAEHIDHQKRQGIDPSAMFYTDLENLPPVVHRIERLHKTNREDFWSW